MPDYGSAQPFGSGGSTAVAQNQPGNTDPNNSNGSAPAPTGANSSETNQTGGLIGNNNGSNNTNNSNNNGAAGSSNVGAAGSGNVGAAGSGNVGAAGSGNVGAAGAGNMGAAGSPAVPLPNGLYFFDDFEGARDPAWTESRVGGTAGVIALDSALGADGSGSSIRIDANNVFHTMLQLALPDAVRTANEVFGRVFLRLAATPSAAHYVWLEVGTSANDGHEMRLGHNVGHLQSNHFLNGEQDIRDQGRALVANQWYCLEFFMDNAPEQLRVWLDGEETALSTTNYTAGAGAEGNTNPVADFIPPLEAFRIGWELQNGTVWFDKVALGSQRIGCD
jgi:hypothetical protein